MIEIQKLSAGYLGKPVLRDVTLAFPPGEVLALVGPNGSGKSTLLKAALGLLPAIQGQVIYDGVDIRHLSCKQIARKAAFLTQSRDTPSIEALRMVLHGRFPYLDYPRRYSQRDLDIAQSAMDATGSRRYENINVAELSGGQRQGVYLAMALAQDTETIFMDEPTTYLDIRRQLETMGSARSLAQSGKAVVMVLHDLSLALREADRVAVFQEGRLLRCDSPDIVFESGVLDSVFGVSIRRMETPHGTQFYCTAKED